MSFTDVHRQMLGDAIDQLDEALDALYAKIDAEDLDGISAQRPRLTYAFVNLRKAEQALGSPPVLGLPAERHQGLVIRHD